MPDVDGGEEVAATVSQAIDDMQSAFAEAQGEAEGMSTESPQAFAEDASRIATSVQQSSQQIQQSLEAVSDNDELEEAADEVEACQQL